MAINAQILLPLVFMVLVEAHYIDYYGPDIDEPEHKSSRWPKRPSEYNDYSYSSPDISMRRPSDYRRNSDIYSYYAKGVYDSFSPYINYFNRFGNQNFHNMPHVTNAWPNSRNKFDYRDNFSRNSLRNINDNDENSYENPSEKFEYSDESQEPEITPLPLSLNPGNQEEDFKSLTDDQKFHNISTKRNEENYANNSKEVSKVNLDAEKDISTVDNNGNNAYLSHQNVLSSGEISNNQPLGIDTGNIPTATNSNKPQQLENQPQQAVNGQPSIVYVSIVANIPGSTVPTDNQPTPENVMYVPVLNNHNNQQQPINPVNEKVNGQHPSIPLTVNRFHSIGNDRASINHVESNPSWNNYSPIYIYANGQLILIPGYAVNPPPNIGYQELNDPSNYLNINPPNQINPPLQVTTTVSPITNDDLKTASISHNVQVVPNPSNTNNLEDRNLSDGNNYPNMTPKKKDNIPIEDLQDRRPVDSIINPTTHLPDAWELENNVNINQQPSSTKDRVEDEDENW